MKGELVLGKSRLPSKAACSCEAEHRAESIVIVGIMVRWMLNMKDRALVLGCMTPRRGGCLYFPGQSWWLQVLVLTVILGPKPG